MSTSRDTVWDQEYVGIVRGVPLALDMQCRGGTARTFGASAYIRMLHITGHHMLNAVCFGVTKGQGVVVDEVLVADVAPRI